ncbi:L-serine ammonia-lyase [Candidatus Leptofilum sp.]|uniref:L-serine ammonia-lyase n=1 Tax=Candidatus Leptofilum sp. TaxID=3241576 RepID=UPI003B5C05E8
MAISIFDLFKIGIGPSSSHTVGPMKIARLFGQQLQWQGMLHQVERVSCTLHGSLGATGVGHGSDTAVLLGLSGHQPDTIDPDAVPKYLHNIRSSKQLLILGHHVISFLERRDLKLVRRALPYHPNGMTFTAWGHNEQELIQKRFYSVGGGFIVDEDEIESLKQNRKETAVPYPFATATELLQFCADESCRISDIVLANELVWRSAADVRNGLWHIWEVMQACVQRGFRTEGVLPGGMQVKRRAPIVYRRLTEQPEAALRDPLTVLDWVNLYALAVNEENAAGGRVVTAPTNGAAGIIPAVLHYWVRFGLLSDAPAEMETAVIRFLLTAGAIGLLYKRNASISGADVGCQGEVGVACSMAAGALAEARGGTPEQVENAAEIGMEHNLGLTCDPVGGLVQIPCIERNAMGAIKAINAARLALRGDGKHIVSLDKVIKTMCDTGADMKNKYKETSQGGLAVNVIEC